MNELALFAGAGGGILGGLLHGWRTVAAVEIEAAPSEPGAASNETSADIAPASRNKDSRRLK